MPTPNDEEPATTTSSTTTTTTGVVPMLVLDMAASMRGAGTFASCPPEEGRGEEAPSGPEQEVEVEMAAMGGAREEGDVVSIVAGGDERMLAGEEEGNLAGEDEGRIPEDGEGKIESESHLGGQTTTPTTTTTTHGTIADLSSSPPPPTPSHGEREGERRERERDVRLAQSMASATITSSEEQTPGASYLHFPELDRDRQTSYNSTTSFLRPGSKFRGTQQSDRQVYDVQVEIKDVDMAESFLCGYLRIQGLTDDHPTLTTFFQGEIIGPKYLFRTDHPSWGSSEKVDMQHWARFPAWRPLAKSALQPHPPSSQQSGGGMAANSAASMMNRFEQREHLFMRWKEYFLVPDHRVKTITGASFEGFYYICFNQCSGTVSGIYFHAKSEKFQQLELRHVEDRGCMPAVEFR